MNIFDVVIKPLLTEKTMDLKEKNNKYVFQVHLKANKIQIKKAIEKSFGVKVLKVNTMNVLGKKKRLGKFRGRTSSSKKAIVTLVKGNSIEYFDGA